MVRNEGFTKRNGEGLLSEALKLLVEVAWSGYWRGSLRCPLTREVLGVVLVRVPGNAGEPLSNT
jgi:hypothetical protein